MGKLNFISNLAAGAAGRVTQDEKSWKEFLKTASRLYRYDFDDQLLIYVQRPDATACAPLEMWNDKMRRWIKPGSKGIALIHKRRDGSNRLDHVFDVSDTRPVQGAREPYLWELREEYRAPVLEALEKRFGRAEGQDTGERLMEIVAGAVLETFSDYLLDLEYDSEGSPLEGVDVAEWEEIFRETMKASVQYAVLTRCGFRPEDYLEDTSLSGITLFSTPAILHHLGDACSRLTMEICTEIRREIRRMEQGVVQDREKERKIAENILEKPSKEVYSESKEKFSAVKRESERKGGNEYGRTGADIQESRGLPDTGPGDGRGGRSADNAHREVRAAQGEFPEGTPSRDLHIHAADGEAGQAPAGSGGKGPGADRPDSGAAYEGGRGGREAESVGSDAVGQKSQRHDSPGGGNGAAGSGLQVKQGQETSEKQNTDRDETAGEHPAVFLPAERSGQMTLFPSAEEQVEKIAQVQAEEKREAPAPGQHVKNLPEGLDRCLNSALAGGGNESDSILRIVAFYQKGPDNKQAAAFLEKEFGVGGKGILVDGVKVSVWFGKDGLFFARGNSALVPGAVLVPWERAAARVRKLLERGTFAARDKLEGARDHEYQRQAESMWYLAQSLSDEAREKGYLPYLRELYGGFPDSTEKIAELLREPGYRHVFCAELDTFIQALQKKPELLRYRRYHPEWVRKEIDSLNISPKQFHCAEGFEPVKGYFVTEDEIDQMLRRGSGVSEGKLRIYSYFMQGHDAKECAAFLRNEYGVGGWGQTGYDEWHDSKGIKFTRADDYSGYKGYDTVFFNWNQVQERIRGLIRDGKYLGAKEKEYLPEYEKIRLARELYNFRQLTPDRPGSVRNVLWDIEKGAAEFRPILDSPKYSAELYEDMVKTFAPLLPEDVRGYETMKKALEDMAAFVRGEYSLFKPLPASVLEAERDRTRRRKDAEKEEKRQERQAAEKFRDTADGKPKNENLQSGPAGKQASEMPKAHQQEGELEKAARALAKKQRAKAGIKQEMDGQFSLDFSAMGVFGADNGETAGQTEIRPVPEKDDIRQEEAPAAEEQEAAAPTAEKQAEKRPDPRLPPHAEEYLALKALHPDKLIAVQVGDLCLFYGKDAEAAAPALDAKLLKREIDGLGETFVTGTKSWQGAVRKALEHGHSILVIGPEPGKGADAPYVAIKERSAADYIPLGMQLVIDGRRMMIDSVDFGRGKVSLKDLEMQGWFPVFREESVAYVRECIEREADREAETEASVETIVEAAEKAGETAKTDAADLEEAKQEQLVPADTVQVFDVGLPFEVAVQKLVTEEEREKERRLQERRDYRITDDNLGAWGQKTRYQNNAAAVRTLKQIEAEGRNATGEEQEILAKYTGWGGLSQAFDPANEKWGKEYAELSGLLTPEEYESARATVLNAFYTSPLVVKAVYAVLGRMEFVPGNILEPSCGAGNFLGLVPEGFAGAKLYGVELDSLTGRIASQLYQKADITIGGFETTDYPDSFFDLALGNVPFGDYKVHDRKYDRLNLNIHDYFLVKALDKVRPGGVMAFVTSKGTMDKADGRAREALAQKADLLGAIRLPNNAFKANADTDVTSDILFFQKRGSAPEKLPDWVAVGETEDGVPLNSYYLQHPEMVLGKMSFWRNMYGNETETACLPTEGADLAGQLSEAVTRIGQPDRALLDMDAPDSPESGRTGKAAGESIAADPDVRNFSFTVKDGKLYYRENSRMTLVEPGKKRAERIQNMIGIRDSARRLIEIQTAGASDSEVLEEQARLNTLYDSFVNKYGLLNSTGNRQAFRQDSSYPLLCSLEILDEEGKFQTKADIFTKRTIRHRQPVTHADTAVEALGVSIGERACVDLGFMASLMGGPEKIPQIVSDLKGIIFKDPDTGPFDMEGEAALWHKGWQTQDAYLSGNVREKLEKARKAAGEYPEFAVNVEALEAVQPKDLTAPEINARIGAPWVDKKYYNEFIYDLLKTPQKLRGAQIEVLYSDVARAWNVTGKWADSMDNTRVYGTYGTKRVNAYEIFEDSLNQRSVEVYDTVEVDGKEKRVLNAKETAIAQQKQEAMKETFREWIFKDPERRADLCATYNRLFNSVRPREYDGQHIQFAGMNPEIALEKHQQNAVARVLYGGNTLLAHVVGAGKTYECIAAAMEGKRLGLCRKSMMVVPNHLTEQWGSDFLTLYPGAKVLVATKKDFEPKNRRKFCARIATGDYDAVIIGHTQFEKIPISPERQIAHLQEQIREIMDGIGTAKDEKQERWTIRQMERTKKSLESKLQRLMDKKRDDTVYFEELGIDRLFVDEAQYYKNLYTYTKMRNVAGIGQADAQKSSDMYAKCQYMDEITGGRGVVFATGTPISNTMVELYTMMRYLQDGMLRRGYKDSAGKVHSLLHFDNWAATFGECVTAVELKPEGTGFRLRTRFARFFNLPELMNMWKEAADIQTADMLNLPTPDVEYVTVQTEASAAQKKMVEALAERAEKIRGGGVDASVDNMLKITSDGRKLALDQRLMNPLLGDDPGSKVNACVETVFRIWQDSTEFKGTQLIFSDLSTPKGKREEKEPEGGSPENVEDGAQKETEEAPTEENLQEYGVYEDIRQKLEAKGIPKEQIAFIHEAHTEAQKAELFAKVRSGQVRVLLGSTQKMGAGTNVQTRLVASHDLDCPWRPADLEQRAGRIVRRGNQNEKVWIYRYVTKGTFDAYTWGLVESKQKFIGQVMTSKSPARSIEDVDATALSYAEVKMLATGDPRIKEKMDLDIQVTKLKMLKANHTALKYELEDKIRGHFPNKIKEEQLYIDCLQADLPVLLAHPAREEQFSMTVQGVTHTERKEAGQALIAACHLLSDPSKEVELGEYRGFPMRLGFDGEKFKVTMKQHLTYTAELSDDAVGNIARINNALDKIPQSLKNHEEQMERLKGELENAKEEAEKPFPQEAELAEKSARLTELNTELDNEERNRGKEPEKDDTESRSQEGRVAESSGWEDTGARAGKKPSILGELRQYERPAAASAVAERGKNSREVI